MKKIALLLAMAIAFTSIATAADVTVGGWIDTRGNITAKSGDANTGNDDPTLTVGSQEFEIAAAVTGDRFGGRIGLIHWSGGNGNTKPDYSDPSNNLETYPFVHNSYVYTDFVPDMVRLYGGVNFFAFGNYTSYAAVDGGDFGGTNAISHWSDTDAFGLGLGAYNYASFVPMTKKPTGLALEVKPVDGLSIVSILDVQILDSSTLLAEDAGKDNLHFNVKYDHEMVTVYTGLTLSDKDAADARGNAFYVEASVKAVENVTADVKFEYLDNKVSDNALSVISANLGYDLGAARIASEINQYLRGGDSSATRATSETVIAFSVKPVVPVVGLIFKGKVAMDDRDDSETLWAVGTTVSKSFGQATNNLGLRYVHDKKDSNKFVADYKITLWF